MAEEESSHQEDNSDSNMLGVLDPTVHATTSAIPQNDTPNFSILSIQHNQEEAGSSRPTREIVLQRLSEALLRHSLAKIDLSQRGLRPSDARLVKMALSQNANLTVLKLGYNNLGDVGIATLASGIAVHKSIISLDLGFNNCGDEGCKALASGMQQAAARYNGGTIQTLYLAGNLIGEDGAIALADFIRKGSSLSKLYLTGNRIGTQGVKSVTEAILEDEFRREESSSTSAETMEEAAESKQPSSSKSISPTRSKSEEDLSRKFNGMQELFLGGTGLGNMGCQCVARLIQKASYLKVISLPNCNIGDEEVGMLAAGIKLSRKSLPLGSVQLSFNSITHRGLEILINAIWGSSTLRELKLDNNEIGDRGAHQISAIIPVLKTLEVLDVGFNSIKVGGLNVLMKAVAQSDHLNQLSISGNEIDVAASKAVAYALAYNQSLHSIFLVHCSVGHEAQRHITAGIVSNSHTALRQLTGFHLGPVVASLGFPGPLEYWTNEQVLNFIHLMWDQTNGNEDQNQSEAELDPLTFLEVQDGETGSASTAVLRGEPLEANAVIEAAQKAYESLVEKGVDVFSRRRGNGREPAFGSPLASDAIIVEVNGHRNKDVTLTSGDSTMGATLQNGDIGSKAATSFVAEPEVSCKHQEAPDPERKRRIVEWLCQNIKHLNELSQKPFSPSELWSLHQHYFTPVVNESGGAVAGDRIVSSVPDINRATIGGSSVTPSTESSDEHLSVPASDPALPNPAGASSLPAMKRKVSYRHLGDAAMIQQSDQRTSAGNQSVARMIEDGHTGHSMPPKTKRARRNRTRISFLPRIKAKLDSYLDVCHEKALSTMRQLYFVEHAILSGQINPVDPSCSSMTHLSGVLASEAEMIVVDMI